MDAEREPVVEPMSIWDGVPEPDIWLPAELDLEPERCLCLRCHSDLPCLTCLPRTRFRPDTRPLGDDNQ